jgi:hypothetical protein
MSAIFDKAEGQTEKQAHREGPLSPPTGAAQPKDNLSDTFSKVEKDRLAKERAEIDGLKEFAQTHNIDLATAQQLKAAQVAQQPQIPPELHSSLESVRQLYPDDKPHEVVQQYAQIDKMIKTDPIGGLAWIAQQSGLNPLQLSRDLAVRFGDQQVVMHNAERMINDWFGSNPGASQYESLMVEAIASGAVKRTGDFGTDLQAAYAHAQRQQRSERKNRKQGKHLDRTLAEAYDRAARRK